MTRRGLDKKNIDVSYLEFLDTCDRKTTLPWTSSSSNDESGTDAKSEVLWCREKNTQFSENDFFKNFQDDFSDLTERTTSSCSWHNDDFDMNSCNKVKASLEAIEGALYEKQLSPLISKSVFQECCDWANKFPFFRLKGEQIVKPVDENLLSYASAQDLESYTSESSSFRLQVEGKKMAIHAPDKMLKKSPMENVPEVNEMSDYTEEISQDDDEHEECLTRDIRWETFKPELHSEMINNASSNVANIESIQEKIIERVALKLWPKVIAMLQTVNQTHSINISDDFQLPPIMSAAESRQLALRRPKTEGTDWGTDFPKLSSILSISPKVLQSKREYGNWRGSLKPPRPNSEIHISHNNHIASNSKSKNEHLKVSSLIPQQSSMKLVELAGTKLTIKEESLFLPSLDEDIQDSVTVDILQNFHEESETKEVTPTTCSIKKLSRKSECFLPPIDGKSLVSSNAKLTRNLFTLFGPSIKYEKGRRIGSAVKKPGSPISRPNTSASRKVLKYSGNLQHKLLNDAHSSLNNSNCVDVKKLNEASSEKQVTLFPIVTSLLPYKERNGSAIKKGLLNSYSGRKR